jgi:hypothetical protein
VIIIKLNYDRFFLPYPFRFIIHHSSYLAPLYNLSTDCFVKYPLDVFRLLLFPPTTLCNEADQNTVFKHPTALVNQLRNIRSNVSVSRHGVWIDNLIY